MGKIKMRKGYFGRILITIMLFEIIFCSCIVFPLNCGSVANKSNLDEIEVITPETATMSVSLKWKQAYDYRFHEANYLDYNNDGYLDLISSVEYTGGHHNNHGLICTNGRDGSEIWKKSNGNNYYHHQIGIYDLDKDGKQEIIIGSDDMYCYDENGNQIWSYSVASQIFSFSIVDIDKDGNIDIIVNSREELLILSYLGSLRYSTSVIAVESSSLAIGNLDMSGDLEIIQVVNKNTTWINCYRPNLNLLWSKELVVDYTDFYVSTPMLADIDPSPGLEIIAPSYSGLVCLESNGDILWIQYGIGFDRDYKPLIADINNDGSKEIITYDWDDLNCHDNSGNLLWQYEFDSNMELGSVIADLDGDGLSELIITTNSFNLGPELSGELYCLNHLGELLWVFSEEFYDITSISTVDLDFDGKLEIVFIGQSGNYYESPGTIYCLEVNGIQKSGKSYWNKAAALNLNTGNIDSDGDTIDDLTENNLGSSRLSNDTDIDGIPDHLEIINGLNPSVHDSADDEDSDGLTNIEELKTYHTSIYNADSDGDSISDFDEVITYETNPASEDTDEDELSDYDEIFVYLTDPNNPDTDEDLVPDGWELLYGFNPLLNDSYVDDDNDTLLVFEEYLAGSSPFSNDTDGDELSDPDEYYIHGTDPGNDNTDGDLMGDFWEVMYGTDPLVDDSYGDPDSDFLVNFEEYREGTDPLNRDTDGDGFVDGDEVNRGYDPLDPDNHPPIPPSPSVKLGISFLSGIFFAVSTLLLFIGVLTKRKLK